MRDTKKRGGSLLAQGEAWLGDGGEESAKPVQSGRRKKGLGFERKWKLSVLGENTLTINVLGSVG